MRLRTIGIIIRREYLNKVKKKSFLLITFLSPILFAALCILPAVIMNKAREGNRRIAVIDRSEIVMPVLQNSQTTEFVNYGDFCIDTVKAHLGDLGYDAVLCISPIDTIRRTVDAEIYSLKPLGADMTENINSRLNSAIEGYRISTYGIDGLDAIMDEVKSEQKIKTYTIDEDGNENLSETSVFTVVSMILGIIIYTFISLFGGMVMSSVIEEKSSRVVEVLISTVKATELMFGKIIGIALVALTQFSLWIILTLAIVGIFSGIASPKFSGEATKAVMADQSGQAVQMNGVGELPLDSTLIITLENMPLTEILVYFLIFFIFGYMLYASLFAAIGSAVENEADSQQLQLPLTVPLLIGFLIAIYTFKNPDSAVSLWGSMIPFTSPVVMLARIPFGVPTWQLALSAGLLVITFGICAWGSAKIYQVGILMFGKKSSWSDLWKWFRQK